VEKEKRNGGEFKERSVCASWRQGTRLRQQPNKQPRQTHGGEEQLQKRKRGKAGKAAENPEPPCVFSSPSIQDARLSFTIKAVFPLNFQFIYNNYKPGFADLKSRTGVQK